MLGPGCACLTSVVGALFLQAFYPWFQLDTTYQKIGAQWCISISKTDAVLGDACGRPQTADGVGVAY
jgi:hypothetical protein